MEWSEAGRGIVDLLGGLASGSRFRGEYGCRGGEGKIARDGGIGICYIEEQEKNISREDKQTGRRHSPMQSIYAN